MSVPQLGPDVRTGASCGACSSARDIEMASMQIITGPERRRAWSEEQKRAIVSAAFAPGAIVADVARRVDVCAGQIYRWRRELRSTGGGFSEVVIAAVDDSGNDDAARRPAAAIKKP